MAHSKHIKGDRAELIAAEYFMNLGYSVHRNMSQHGPVDMVLLEEDGKGETILVDVKALSLRTKNGWKVCRTPTKKQKELGVQLVFVDLNKREVLDVLPQKPRKRHGPNVVNLKDYKKVTREEAT
jgi:Holliday junction resolvase-like predicted endonuclease|tara:strand:- start:1089 stop:1463 length:375 start_codon:yes stop_codon:yes gene_type:complete